MAEPIALAVGRSTRAGEHADTLMLGLLSCAVALLHVSAAVGHWSESAIYGISFVVLAVAQAAWGVLLLRRPGDHRGPLRLGCVLNVAIIAVYLCSRAVGLPVGPDKAGPESFGPADVIATLDELMIVGLALLLLRRRGRPLPEWATAGLLVLGFVSLIAFVALSHVG